jgi:hypothetical protein
VFGSSLLFGDSVRVRHFQVAVNGGNRVIPPCKSQGNPILGSLHPTISPCRGVFARIFPKSTLHNWQLHHQQSVSPGHRLDRRHQLPSPASSTPEKREMVWDCGSPRGAPDAVNAGDKDQGSCRAALASRALVRLSAIIPPSARGAFISPLSADHSLGWAVDVRPPTSSQQSQHPPRDPRGTLDSPDSEYHVAQEYHAAAAAAPVLGRP